MKSVPKPSTSPSRIPHVTIVFERDFPNAAEQMKETTARRLERSGSPE